MNASSREPPPQDWEARLVRVEFAIERIDKTLAALRADVDQLREQFNALAREIAVIKVTMATLQSSLSASTVSLNDRLDRADRRMDVIEVELASLRDGVADNSLQIEKLRSQMYAMRAADLRYYTAALAGVTATLLGAMAKGFHWL
jgi:predicted  nucleic acid-binding Zn-ribbon protein